MGATRRNLQAQPKILKKLSEQQINQSEGTKKIKKKVCLVPCVGGYPTEFAREPKKQ
jgi:hypothetical protein